MQQYYLSPEQSARSVHRPSVTVQCGVGGRGRSSIAEKEPDARAPHYSCGSCSFLMRVNTRKSNSSFSTTGWSSGIHHRYYNKFEPFSFYSAFSASETEHAELHGHVKDIKETKKRNMYYISYRICISDTSITSRWSVQITEIKRIGISRHTNELFWCSCAQSRL